MLNKKNLVKVRLLELSPAWISLFLSDEQYVIAAVSAAGAREARPDCVQSFVAHTSTHQAWITRLTQKLCSERK